MTDGLTAVLAGAALVASIGGQLFDTWLTAKGLDAGFQEVGLIAKHIIKSKADEGKLPLLTFVESVAILTLFGAVFSIWGSTAALVFASALSASVWANNIADVVKLKRKNVKIF